MSGWAPPSAVKREHTVAPDVRAHYDVNPEQDKNTRLGSNILSLKNLNNWFKSIVMSKYARPHMCVLDLCCGKGGDLLKFHKAKVGFVVMADLSPVCVSHALNRYNTMTGGQGLFEAIFISGDCGLLPLAPRLPPALHFDLVSCQFALHYAFESEERARMLLRNASERLVSGGAFVATIPDANVIVKKLRSTPGLAIENSVFQITFDEAFAEKKLPKAQPFGIRYHFWLKDGEAKPVFAPEFLVHLPTLVRLAAEFSLELEWKCNFHDLYFDYCERVDEFNDYRALLHRMKVYLNGPMPPDEWEAAYLYMAIAFRKTGPPTPIRPKPHDNQRPRNKTEADIIVLGAS
eukprot:gnl/Hemi2/9096_TR3153_c0_g1_i1.p1 gnl/Hemi2/9096_TR3153_c0_g1~~gnl/Hemi2/9096_TR3153_c0_g1_i1.p1  ORF type:complete len:347 (-),score=43.44 gnl/Hemi2/9096_TR3153_c0_g1_i1:85-1125(-)